MIDYDCMKAYHQKYPDDDIGRLPPEGFITISNGSKTVIQPEKETKETFMERLERCTKERNAFMEEWGTFSYESGILY